MDTIPVSPMTTTCSESDCHLCGVSKENNRIIRIITEMISAQYSVTIQKHTKSDRKQLFEYGVQILIELISDIGKSEKCCGNKALRESLSWISDPHLKDERLGKISESIRIGNIILEKLNEEKQVAIDPEVYFPEQRRHLHAISILQTLFNHVSDTFVYHFNEARYVESQSA